MHAVSSSNQAYQTIIQHTPQLHTQCDSPTAALLHPTSPDPSDVYHTTTAMSYRHLPPCSNCHQTSSKPRQTSQKTAATSLTPQWPFCDPPSVFLTHTPQYSHFDGTLGAQIAAQNALETFGSGNVDLERLLASQRLGFRVEKLHRHDCVVLCSKSVESKRATVVFLNSPNPARVRFHQADRTEKNVLEGRNGAEIN